MKEFQFLRGLKRDSILFGDFNVNTSVDSTFRNDYEQLLFAYDFKQQIFRPITVTATSPACLDYFITSFQVQTETIPKTNRDHFTALGGILLLTNEPKHQLFFRKTRGVRRIKGDKALNFLFLLNQKTANTIQVDKKAQSRFESVRRFHQQEYWLTKKN